MPSEDKIQKVIKGDTIIIEKQENLSAGFMWKWKILEGEKRVKFLRVESYQPEMLGAAAQKKYLFKTKKTGAFVIEFQYLRFGKDTVETDTLFFEIIEK